MPSFLLESSSTCSHFYEHLTRTRLTSEVPDPISATGRRCLRQNHGDCGSRSLNPEVISLLLPTAYSMLIKSNAIAIYHSPDLSPSPKGKRITYSWDLCVESPHPLCVRYMTVCRSAANARLTRTIRTRGTNKKNGTMRRILWFREQTIRLGVEFFFFFFPLRSSWQADLWLIFGNFKAGSDASDGKNRGAIDVSSLYKPPFSAFF